MPRQRFISEHPRKEKNQHDREKGEGVQNVVLYLAGLKESRLFHPGEQLLRGMPDEKILEEIPGGGGKTPGAGKNFLLPERFRRRSSRESGVLSDPRSFRRRRWRCTDVVPDPPRNSPASPRWEIPPPSPGLCCSFRKSEKDQHQEEKEGSHGRNEGAFGVEAREIRSLGKEKFRCGARSFSGRERERGR